MPKLLYKQEKRVRGSKLIIYANGTIVMQSKTSKYGIHVPIGLYKWKKLPNKKNDCELNVLVDFWHKESKFEKVPCIIYHNNYECYLRPIGNGPQEINILKLMKKNSILKCIIPEKVGEIQQIPATDYFKRALSLREKITLPDIYTLNLLTLGGMQKTKYEIFSDNKMNLFFRCKGKVDRKGVLVLSSEISRFIQDWFVKENLCLCSINDQAPLILPLTLRKRNSTVKVYKELNIPYYGYPKEVTVYFSVVNSQLTVQATKDLQLKSLLTRNGINIIAFKSNLRHGKHYNEVFENQVRNFIESAYKKSEDSTVLSEVEIIINNDEHLLNGRDKHRFDFVVYHQKDLNDYLALIELKTSIEPTNKSGIIESAIAKLYNFRKRIGNGTVIPILIINEDVHYKGNLYTKQFGELCDIIIIGRNELVFLIQNPTKLHDRINQYLNNQIPSQAPLATILKTVNSFTEGSDFENEIKQQLLSSGYKVKSNIVYRIQNKHLEIDHVAIKEREKLLVSCKDHRKVKSEWRIISKLTDELNIIALRKTLLGFTKARLYMKIHSDLKNKIIKIVKSKKFVEADVFIL